MKLHEIIKVLQKLSCKENIKGMAKFGITPEQTYGIKIPHLRDLAKKIGKDHDLAMQLWKEDTRETQILASLVAEPSKLTNRQMEDWIKDFNYWEICDQCCMNLFEKLDFAYEKATELCVREAEFARRTGFVLMARLGVSDKKAQDKKFTQFFPYIIKGATDERNMVKKAVNWALRQIGKRNLKLHSQAIEIAEEIIKIDSRSAKWIAADALRELKNEKIINRLRKKK